MSSWLWASRTSWEPSLAPCPPRSDSVAPGLRSRCSQVSLLRNGYRAPGRHSKSAGCQCTRGGRPTAWGAARRPKASFVRSSHCANLRFTACISLHIFWELWTSKISKLLLRNSTIPTEVKPAHLYSQSQEKTLASSLCFAREMLHSQLRLWYCLAWSSSASALQVSSRRDTLVSRYIEHVPMCVLNAIIVNGASHLTEFDQELQ